MEHPDFPSAAGEGSRAVVRQDGKLRQGSEMTEAGQLRDGPLAGSGDRTRGSQPGQTKGSPTVYQLLLGGLCHTEPHPGKTPVDRRLPPHTHPAQRAQVTLLRNTHRTQWPPGCAHNTAHLWA